MRVLCLNLQKSADLGFTEAFLRFSPKVQMRTSPDGPSLIFIDITSTTHLFSGETPLFQQALKLAQTFYPHATAAISDSPQGAQVMAAHFGNHIVSPGEERAKLSELPLTVLTELEGLVAWQKREEIHQIISLFHILGLQSVAELEPLRAESFRERWGKTGELLWKRLHMLEQQELTPLSANEPLTHYTHLDEPISLLSFLLYYVEKNTSYLCQRLHGRALAAQKVKLTLYCEYSEEKHHVEIELTPTSRDLSLILELLEGKLSTLELQNPIRELEIDIVALPENIKQLDFFEPRTSDHEKVQRLRHLFAQKNVAAGFLQIKNGVFPENTFSIKDEPSAFEPTKTVYDAKSGGLKKLTAHGAQPKDRPRPTRLLTQPLKLRKSQLEKVGNIFPRMMERLEDSWWTSSDQKTESRDYYFAVSPQRQFMWLYRNRQTKEYYVHGYGD